MKLFPLLLGASLLGNVIVLLAAGTRLIEYSRAPASPVPSAVRAESLPDQPNAWSALANGDLAEQLARLRDEGFPPRIVRAIMVAQIRAQFRARRDALELAERETPFWLAQADARLQAEQRAFAREEQKLLNELLGREAHEESLLEMRRGLPPEFSAATVEQVAAIRERYEAQRQELYAANRGVFSTDAQKRMEAIDKAMREELTAVLSPQEFEAYELRQSRTAQQLRYTLANFDATEQEYLALFRLQHAYNTHFGNFAIPSSPEGSRLRAEAARKLAADIQATLGPARYADYERATDDSYRRTSQVIARLQLSEETARAVYEIERTTRERLAQLRQLAPAERTAQIKVLAGEAESKLAGQLGTTGLRVYQEYAGGWLKSLSPPPPKQSSRPPEIR